MEVEILEDALEENFDYDEKRQGRVLYQKDKVSKLKISKDQITASVKDGYANYQIVLDYDEYEFDDFIEFDGECTCPQQFYCEHQAAVIYNAIEKLNKVLKFINFPILQTFTIN